MKATEVKTRQQYEHERKDQSSSDQNTISLKRQCTVR